LARVVRSYWAHVVVELGDGGLHVLPHDQMNRDRVARRVPGLEDRVDLGERQLAVGRYRPRACARGEPSGNVRIALHLDLSARYPTTRRSHNRRLHAANVKSVLEAEP